jgi:XrtJ-associated TM-motif-TM protein
MKSIRYSWMTMAFILVTASLHAQGGCTDSPEAPTLVLMVVGAVGLSAGCLAPRKIWKGPAAE